MPTLLLKTEPGEYSFDDLMREGVAVWSGVTAAPAQKVMRESSRGDRVFIYHTGGERAIVGTGVLDSGPYPDPAAAGSKLVVFKVRAGTPVARPVTLGAIRADPRFGEFALVRQGRLSVVPVPDELDRLLRQMAGIG